MDKHRFQFRDFATSDVVNRKVALHVYFGPQLEKAGPAFRSIQWPIDRAYRTMNAKFFHRVEHYRPSSDK